MATTFSSNHHPTAQYLTQISVAALDDGNDDPSAAAMQEQISPSIFTFKETSTIASSCGHKHQKPKISQRIAFVHASCLISLSSFLTLPPKAPQPTLFERTKSKIIDFLAKNCPKIRSSVAREKFKPSESYHHLLQASRTHNGLYDPLFLDDPELRPGKHQSVLCLASMISSLTPHIRASTLKRCLNDEFKRGPGSKIHPSLSLSKIRSLKRKIVEATIQCHLEILTAAKAYTLLEKLILLAPGASYVTSSNRKLVAAVCLLLMKKIDDSNHHRSVDDNSFFAICERIFGIAKNAILGAEVEVFVQARFDLQLREEEFVPHFERIINTLEFSNVQEYLGERMYGLWKRDCL